MLASLLFFGLLLGVRHALEADHVTAVAALASRSRSLADHVKLAGAWGVGHAGTLLAFGAVLLALDASLPEAAVRGLEGIAGVVLILLGADVLSRARRDRIHFHAHRHDDGTTHVHAHAHELPPVAHDQAAHRHEHPSGALPRALLVGGLHGLAGSAPLVLIAAGGNASVLQATASLAAFALGSILGMVLFSMSISLPARWSRSGLGSTLGALQRVLGTVTAGIGFWVVLRALLGHPGG
jgi:sulfite exporter TauE/SafE